MYTCAENIAVVDYKQNLWGSDPLGKDRESCLLCRSEQVVGFFLSVLRQCREGSTLLRVLFVGTSRAGVLRPRKQARPSNFVHSFSSITPPPQREKSWDPSIDSNAGCKLNSRGLLQITGKVGGGEEKIFSFAKEVA